jgi:hypothetical protein
MGPRIPVSATGFNPLCPLIARTPSGGMVDDDEKRT